MKKWIPLLFLPLLIACNGSLDKVQTTLNGYAQGTTFQIKYVSAPGKDLSGAVDSLFKAVDASLSTYNKNSLISHINAHADSIVQVDALFKQVYERSAAIASETGGAFDPTVGPLVELWGFGNMGTRSKADSTRVDSVLRFVGYERVWMDRGYFHLPGGYRIDFNAIAQGFTVDLISTYLEQQGVKDYFVEVGGETRARGTNVEGRVWRIGIDKPTEELEEGNRLKAIVELKDLSLATSGNYRKFWVDEETGIKYAHTIDPRSGFPARNRLLSATIACAESMDADAYATVCMVLGVEQSKKFLAGKPGVEAYLIYTNDEGEWEVYATPGMREWLIE